MKKFLLAASSLMLALSAHADGIDDLSTAAYRDNASAVTTLLVQGVNPNQRDAKGRTPLDVAIHFDNDRALQALLADPALDVELPNSVGETPLMQAAIKGRVELMEQLVKRGALINREGWTPLQYAASGETMAAARWLLKHGADVNARGPEGRTALMMAAGFGPVDLADVLLAAGADVTARDEHGRSAADYAANAGHDALRAHLQALLSAAAARP
ncbi:MAG: ankyrin repeat domain-containing protein [Paucibacter sp.]|nr:ankyrin repeat domain-containing protein [Roseateles sp.]